MRKRHRHSKIGRYLKSDFPLIYDYLCVLKFPFQILAVGLVGLIAVNLYTSYFSYSASQKNFNSKASAQGSESAQADSPSLDNGDLNITEPDQKLALLSPEAVLQDDALKAESTINDNKRETTQPEVRVESASYVPNNVSGASEHGTTADLNHLDSNLYNGEWLQQQPKNHYVVQLAASTEQQKLIQYAKDKVFKPPVAIYPFKVNKNGEMVYGLSVGLFSALNDARTELPALSDKNDQNGVWVRKVADLKDEMSALKP